MGLSFFTRPGVAVRDTGERSRTLGRVLVVDDDDEMRAMLRRMLESDEYDVTEQSRATHVLETLRKNPFDLVILDKEMPGLTGIDLLPVLRREFPQLPVVFITAFGGRQVASAALRLGATKYLEKPFRLAQLRDAIDGVFSPPANEPRVG